MAITWYHGLLGTRAAVTSTAAVHTWVCIIRTLQRKEKEKNLEFLREEAVTHL